MGCSSHTQDDRMCGFRVWDPRADELQGWRMLATAEKGHVSRA